MKKTKLSLALMTALLSVGTLAGCDYYPTYSPKGTLISYTVGDERVSISAEEIFAEYYNDSDKYQSIFDAIKSIIVRNYFTVTETVELPTKDSEGNPQTKDLGLPQLPDLKVEATRKVDADKHQAQQNAKNNNTTYDKEFTALLSSKGVETEADLFEKYLDELKTAKFEENYYKYQLSEIKNGSSVEGLKDFWTGYFDEMLPYHVSHILVKLDDSGSTNYWNGTISESNCEKLYNVIDALTTSDKKFQKIANQYSDDTGSAAKYGDLGIMDYSTSYVNEFKLGVYAYENLYGDFTETAAASKISIPVGKDANHSIKSNFIDESEKMFGITGSEIPEVDVSVFTDLYNSRKVTRSTILDVESKSVVSDEDVMEGNSLVYPRNVIYNEQLNRHSFAFVTTKETVDETRFVDNDGNLVEGATGFHVYETENAMNGHAILSVVVAGVIRPLLMVRAGTSDYQGIHFIVVNRDPFTEVDENGVTKDEYYTTYHVNQDGYPKDENGKAKQTYVNFNSELGGQDSNSRADNFVASLKSFDSDKLSKYIFKKYLAHENITIKDENLAYALDRWIDNSISSKERETKEAWESTWTGYVGTLRKENEDRTKLMSPLSRVGFERKLSSTLTAVYDEVETTKVVDYKINGEDTDTLRTYGLSIGMTSEQLDADIAKIAEFNKNHEDSPIEKIRDLYNLKGALCNDGKEYK